MRGEVPPGPEMCKPLSLPETPNAPNQGKSAAGVSNDVAIADRAVREYKEGIEDTGRCCFWPPKERHEWDGVFGRWSRAKQMRVIVESLSELEDLKTATGTGLPK